MKNFLKNHGFPLLMILISVVMGIVFYDVLPEKFPVHWVGSEPDSFAAKSIWSVFQFTFFIIFVYLLFLAIPKIDPRREHIAKFKQYNLLRDIILVFLIFAGYVGLRAAASPNQEAPVYIITGVGFLFILLGNYLPKVKSNFFIGIRTPWTLSSDEVWKRTHRIGGKLFVLMGIIIIITSFLPPDDASSWFILGPLIVFILFLIIYSYCLFKKLEGKQIDNKST